MKEPDKFVQQFYKQGMNTVEKKYMAKNQKPSKVLLVCVYDTIVFEITPQIVRAKFEKYGTIIKLLIFDKGEVTKFFIQYSDIEQAIQAKKALDGVKLYDALCKMSIYFSNFANVDIKHEDIQNPALYNMEIKQLQQFEDFTKSTNKQRGDVYVDIFAEDPFIKAFGGFNQFTSGHRSKTDNPKTLQDQISRLQQAQHYKHFKDEDELDHSIKKSIDCLLGSPGPKQSKIKFQNETKLKIKQDSNSRSSVLWFPHKNKLKPSLVYNLFSNFGNLSCVVIKKDSIYIKFRSKQFAAIVYTYLNNTTLAQNTLTLRECPQISDLWKPSQNQYCEAIYYDSSFDRFTQQRSITINPPSNTIHVSSMKKQICRENVLKNIFDQYGLVQKVHILQQSNERNMALVRFASIQDSFNAIAHLHNENFSGRKMQISFTKSKI